MTLPKSVIEAKQSLAEMQQMILSVFSCVAYIREFFPDEHFEDTRFCEMSLKRIKGGVNAHADRLLDWIQKGCFDALKKKYLESITLGIFYDPENPHVMLEAYTMTVNYPSSKQHELVDLATRPHSGPKDTASPTLSLTLEDEGKKRQVGPCKGRNVPRQIMKVLRTLCIMMQTLKPLPMKKFVSMQITYYDDLTPADYEPFGFTSPIFDVQLLFTEPTFKHDFGPVESAHHRLSLGLETTADESVSVSCAGKIEEEEQQQLQLLEQKDQVGQDETVPEQKENTPIAAPRDEILVPDEPTAANAPLEKPKTARTTPIHCLCGDNEDDLDMIQCDRCELWLHTPCAGFCTNKDKRIPERFVCHNCEFRDNKKLLRNLQDLASLRRAISVIYSEGLESISWFSKRLDCGVAKAAKLIRRLESEGLVSKPSSQTKVFHYSVHKTPEAKDKIRYFFGLDLSVFPELAVFFKSRPPKQSAPSPNTKRANATDANSTGKRRRSISAEKVSCN